MHYYASDSPALPSPSEHERDALRSELAAHLVESEIAIVELVDSNAVLSIRPHLGRADDFDRFSLPALEASVFGARLEARGAEYDLLVRSGEQPPGVIVTVRHDLDARLVVIPGGPPLVLSGTAPAASELSSRFGIGPMFDGESAWTGDERLALATALDQLSQAELDYLRGLPFRRDKGGPSSLHAGLYQFQDGERRGEIVLFDRAFLLDGARFVGTPDRAYPYSIAVILHEIGHAIAKLDREMLSQIYRRDIEKFNSLVAMANEYVEPLNARYRIVDQVLNSQKQRLIRQDIRTLEEEHEKIKKALRDARKRFAEVNEALESPSPIEQAYGALRGARQGPTIYGSTTVEEGFAEAFALYHLDPECIERISPEVHDWFIDGGYLSASMYPPLPTPRPPSGVISNPDFPLE